MVKWSFPGSLYLKNTQKHFKSNLLLVVVLVLQSKALSIKWERGLESSETEGNVQEWGLGFREPHRLGQTLGHLSVNPFDTMFAVCERLVPVLSRCCSYSSIVWTLPEWLIGLTDCSGVSLGKFKRNSNVRDRKHTWRLVAADGVWRFT